MFVLFTAKLAENQKEVLRSRYPNQQLMFCNGMDEARKYLSKTNVLVSYGSDITKEVMNEATGLKWIMVLSAGMDKLPLDDIKARGIIVTNVRGIHKIQMSEYAISMLLQVSRQEKLLVKKESEHIWQRGVKINEITGKTMLIIGAGSIGQEVARLAKAFRMTTYGIARSEKELAYFDAVYPVEKIEGLLPEADFIVSILPSTIKTKAFFTEEHFSKMRNTAVFLNMGRGDAVRSETILRAIQRGEIAHAILDVFEEEPLPADHPFWQEENITITPHISGSSPNYLERGLKIFTTNMDMLLANNEDKLINEIDVIRGY